MCGIFGFTGKPDVELLARMGSALIHRGPDDGGSLRLPWVSLGHRRLSIIDLAGGHQPLANEDGTVWLVFNGEVYNYRELRAELIERGHAFRTNSDSEVIVHAYEEFGPDCFVRFNGMWAAALANLRQNKLVLARDHFGIKPLYYARSSGRLLFASEIKALLQDPSLPAPPNDQMIYEYLVHGLHDHRPETFFEGIYHLMPATYMEVAIDGRGVSGPETVTTYWTPRLGEDGSADPDEFRRLFRKAVERRLVAEVPVGSCLSGGLDSTTIVTFMSDLLKEEAPDAASLRGRLKTFSAVFDNDPIDEREYIAAAVEATGADTTYIRPLSETFVDELRDFIWHQEEPFVSTGPYAQWCVMREARNQVTVLLDGQGGDELLAGYVPYHFVYLRQLWKERKLGSLVRETWAARDILKPFLGRRLRQRKKVLSVRSLLKPEFVNGISDPGYGRSLDNLKLRLLQDVTTYSLPALLRYEDKNSMAHSLESRVPYLDQELVEWILRLPPRAIIKDGWSRYILRTGLNGVLPEKIRRRRWKVGFTTPEIRWLKARRTQFLSLYRSPTFQSRRYWKGEEVVRAFLAACQGKIEDSMFFWRAINVELWLREFVDARAAGLILEQIQAAQKQVAAGSPSETGASAVAAPDGDPAALPAVLSEPGPIGPRHRGSMADLGDCLAAALSHAEEAWHLLEAYRPNRGKHLFAAARGRIYARLPIKTEVVRSGDDLAALFRRHVAGQVRPGDIVVIAEKPVAISQGRSFPIDEIKVTWLARALTSAVTKTPHGIGLGIPETMQLALNEAGPPRIIFAAIVSAFARLFGIRGVFYRIAGPTVEAIDGPTPYTLPPHNKQAKLGPRDPSGVARQLAAVLGQGIGVAVIDASDLSVKVLGCSEGVDARLVETLMRDNPLGQGHQQTPIAILRDVGELAAG